jgi:hypothetical protein
MKIHSVSIERGDSFASAIGITAFGDQPVQTLCDRLLRHFPANTTIVINHEGQREQVSTLFEAAGRPPTLMTR